MPSPDADPVQVANPNATSGSLAFKNMNSGNVDSIDNPNLHYSHILKKTPDQVKDDEKLDELETTLSKWSSFAHVKNQTDGSVGDQSTTNNTSNSTGGNSSESSTGNVTTVEANGTKVSSDSNGTNVTVDQNGTETVSSINGT
jgi:hypothetical protein